MKSVCLESGGKNAALVFEEKDIDKAVQDIAASKLQNSGQICVSKSRIYVHERASDKFLEKFTEEFHNVTLGDPLDPKADFGPLIDKIQFEPYNSAKRSRRNWSQGRFKYH